MSELKQNESGVIYSKISTSYDKNNIVVFSYEDVLLPGIYNLYIRIAIPINIVKDSFGIYINGNKE